MVKIRSLLNKITNTPSLRRGMEIPHVIHLDSIDSTNNWLMDYKPADDETITVVYADEQTAGRGQGTNHWESEAGKNLTFSILIHPTMVPVARQFLLSEMGALALYEVLGEILGKDDITMKWPNDIYWKDKKISGTLIETRLGGGHIKDCVFGVGLNVNQDAFVGDAPNPVSMKQILGHDMELKPLLDKIITSFKKYYTAVENGEYAAISELYHAGLYHAHGFHKYQDKDGEFEAAIIEVEDNGTIVMRDKNGMIRNYMFKEVNYGTF